MCECLSSVGDKLKAHLQEQIPDGSEVSENMFDQVGWDNQVLNLSKGSIDVMLRYRMAYKIKKKNGDIAKNFTRIDTCIRMSYCPFCGEKQ